MLFDITSESTSKEFLCDFLGIDSEIVNQYIKKCNNDICVDTFLEYANRSLENKDIDDLQLAVVHVTTNNDECQTIREIGLVKQS